MYADLDLQVSEVLRFETISFLNKFERCLVTRDCDEAAAPARFCLLDSRLLTSALANSSRLTHDYNPKEKQQQSRIIANNLHM